nr:MAG TPA_asm: centriole protein [Caudoviricetes sp.]DAM57674.1 MAG TPA: centriole protein [Caudoviricetes sp.]
MTNKWTYDFNYKRNMFYMRCFSLVSVFRRLNKHL